MVKNVLYEQLISSEPMGFIDPFTDLGDFDFVQMKFKQPVRQLINKYSGTTYSPQWQMKIEQMRILYIQYQQSLKETDTESSFQVRARSEKSKKDIEDIVTVYLKLGFKFSEVEKRVQLSNKRLRTLFKRSDYVTTASAEFFKKEDLRSGYYLASHHLPNNLKIK